MASKKSVKKSSLGTSALAALAGAALGGLAGLLLAPTSGKAAREKVASTAKKAVKKAKKLEGEAEKVAVATLKEVAKAARSKK